MSYTDSTNHPIKIGDKVRFRGEIYTIAEFIDGAGMIGTAAIKFLEPQDTEEIADEISVDLISDG